jgi:hypothetical protein
VVLQSLFDHAQRPTGLIAALTPRFGWQAFVTNATQKRLSFAEAVYMFIHTNYYSNKN